MSQHPTSGPRTVVVAVDGSPASVAALRYARHLATELRLELVAVIATDDLEPWDWSYPYQGFDPVEDAGKHLARVVGETFDGEHLDGIGRLVLRGRAVDAITSFARDAALLVVGKRRHSAVVSALLGSVAAGCAARASSPVVLVPAPPTGRTGERVSAGAGHAP